MELETDIAAAGPATAPPATAPDPKTTAAVAKCLAILEADPRTAELAQLIPGAIQSVAMANGVAAEAGMGLPGDVMADVFQGISDAWSKANQSPCGQPV
jgi:hypothetical protein